MSILNGVEPSLPLPECLLKLKRDRFDGLFLFCDEEAWHVIDAILKTDGLDISDFHIASFDNLGAWLSYPIALCSVGCDYGNMALQGFNLLRDRIHGNTHPPKSIVCPVTLVCRGSCSAQAFWK